MQNIENIKFGFVKFYSEDKKFGYIVEDEYKEYYFNETGFIKDANVGFTIEKNNDRIKAKNLFLVDKDYLKNNSDDLVPNQRFRLTDLFKDEFKKDIKAFTLANYANIKKCSLECSSLLKSETLNIDDYIDDITLDLVINFHYKCGDTDTLNIGYVLNHPYIDNIRTGEFIDNPIILSISEYSDRPIKLKSEFELNKKSEFESKIPQMLEDVKFKIKNEYNLIKTKRYRKPFDTLFEEFMLLTLNLEGYNQAFNNPSIFDLFIQKLHKTYSLCAEDVRLYKKVL